MRTDKNLLLECELKPLMVAKDSGATAKAWDNCRSNFTIFHILNYIMYTHALNAFDIIEENGMMREKVKHHRNLCDKDWNRYQHFMKSKMADCDWYLLQDYCMAAFDNSEQQSTMMRICFNNFLLKNKCKNADMVSYLAVSMKVAEIFELLWKTYFNVYKKAGGLDFSGDFKYAYLDKFVYSLKFITNTLSNGNKVVHFADDTACSNAMFVFEDLLTDEDFRDKAAKQALVYSEKYRPLYEKAVSESKESKNNECNN